MKITEREKTILRAALRAYEGVSPEAVNHFFFGTGTRPTDGEMRKLWDKVNEAKTEESPRRNPDRL